jgi:hypothetical protein
MLLAALTCTPLRSPAAAPAKEPPLTSPADAVVWAARDIKRIPPLDSYFQRYLWAVNPGPRLRAAWKLHLNLLSRYSEMIAPEEITPWLWRIDIREPIWDPVTLENAVEVDVFFHQRYAPEKETVYIKYWPGGKDKSGKHFDRGPYKETVRVGGKTFVTAAWLPLKEMDELRKATCSEAPVLMAEWLFAQSCRQLSLRRSDKEGLGYYDFLQVKDRDTYFKLVGLDVKLSKDFGREFREALDKSGISPQNRQIGRLGSVGGGVWFTLDVAKQKGDGIAIEKLKPGEFKHDAEEWYAPGANGLPKTFLGDDKGVLQAVAPGDKVGLHDRSPANEAKEATLQSNLGCINCHAKHVLHPFRGSIREQYTAGERVFLGSDSKKLDLEFRRYYLSDVYKYLAKDQLEYFEAFRLATVTSDYPLGLSTEQATRYYSRTFFAYSEDPITLDVAARELGVKTEVFLRALRNYGKPPELGGKASTIINISLARFLNVDKEEKPKPLPLTRLTWENVYHLAQQILADDRARGLKP